jgi:N-methylhydantoinase B
MLLDGLAATTMFERRIVAPYGVAGGEPGATMRVTLESGGHTREMRGKENAALAAGDLVRVETPGGGGYGTRP